MAKSIEERLRTLEHEAHARYARLDATRALTAYLLALLLAETGRPEDFLQSALERFQNLRPSGGAGFDPTMLDSYLDESEAQVRAMVNEIWNALPQNRAASDEKP